MPHSDDSVNNTPATDAQRTVLSNGEQTELRTAPLTFKVFFSSISALSLPTAASYTFSLELFLIVLFLTLLMIMKKM